MPIYRTYGERDSQVGEQGDRFFSKFNTRLRADTLPEGTLAFSQNGRMAEDGSWETRPGVYYLAGAPDAASQALILPFFLYADVVISAAERVNTLVTVTTASPHGFSSDTQVGIYDISGSVSPTGNRLVTVTASDEFTFVIPGASGSETYVLGSSPKAGSPQVIDAVNQVWGSCRFSPPGNTESEYIILAQKDNALAYLNGSGSPVTIDYPAGITITTNVELLQAFDKVILFRGGATALEWDGDTSGSPAFTKVANGNYTQPTVFTGANNAAATGGVVTITEASHGLLVGDVVKIIDPGSSASNLATGQFYTVATVPGSGSFTFFADVDNFGSTSVVLGKAQSEGLGFTHMPAPAWGVYHQRRLIVPFFYTTSGTSGSEVITDRNIRDELLISDILDYNTFDVLQNSFRITGGSADFLQTVHPFTEDNAIVFCRNSVHLLSGLSGSLNDITLKEITREVGLVARKSIQQIGNQIYFLSDNGIYALTFEDFYNLRGTGIPLSMPIQPTLDNANPEAISSAVAAYWNNRYWLAYPDGTSSRNNKMLVYNLLNEGWESVDTCNASGWNIRELVKIGAGQKDRLFAVSAAGGISEIDGAPFLGADYVIAVPGQTIGSLVNIPNYMTTRGYRLGATGRKRFTELEVEFGGPTSNTTVISYSARNPDSSGDLSNISVPSLGATGDAVVNGRIGGVRADSIQITLSPTSGAFEARALRVRGELALNSLTTVQ